MGSCGDASENICAETTQFLMQFNKDVESFYDTMSIRKGFIHSWGADGKVKALSPAYGQCCHCGAS